jgi:DNA-binding PadR family transcriptional regulator
MIAGAIIQLRRGVLAYCVIALVERQERYGLDLVSELVESGSSPAREPCTRCLRDFAARGW